MSVAETVERREKPMSLPARRSVWSFVRSSGLQSVVVGPSKDPNAKITILLVSPETGEPVLAVKAATTDRAGVAVEAERQVLASLTEHVAGAVVQAIPRPVETLDYDGRPAVVTTAVRGRAMTLGYVRRRHRRSPARVTADFAAAGNWLASFRQATAADAAPLEMDGGVAERLCERFGDREELDDDLERLAEIAAVLRAETVARTAVHGDFWFGNILLTGGRVTGVVDWEAGTTSGEPARDVARFAHMYALYLGGSAAPRHRVTRHPGIRAGTWGAVVEYALDGIGWFPELFRQFLRDGLAAVHASPDVWRSLALAAIAEVAAFTDHDDFARLHLDLFRRCSRPSRLRKEKR
jgi:hypothetical protein